MFYTKTKSFITKGTLSVLGLSSIMFATTLADDYMYVNATHLNVRVAGTFRSAIVATVDNGYKVTILEAQDNGWKKVLLENGAEGYVNGRYLTEQAPYFAKAEGASYTVSVPRAFVRGEGLVKKVAVLAKGDRLEVLDEKVFLGKWLRVRVISSLHDRYNERVGYISTKLVSVDEGSQYAVPTEEAPVDTVSEADTTMNSAPAEDPVTQTTETTPTEETTTTDGSDDLGSLLGDLMK